MIDTSEHPYRTPPPCDHGISFDEDAWRKHRLSCPVFGTDMPAGEVRKRWPRLDGVCPKGCGYSGIYYVSMLHYVAGDW